MRHESSAVELEAPLPQTREARVRAEVVGGRLESLVVVPRPLRLNPDGVVDHIREAVNQALDAAGTGGASPPMEDPLAKQLCRIREEPPLGRARIGRHLDAVLERLRQAGR